MVHGAGIAAVAVLPIPANQLKIGVIQKIQASTPPVLGEASSTSQSVCSKRQRWQVRRYDAH